MPDLNFEVVDAAFPDGAAVPTLFFKLKISHKAMQERIQSIALRCQLMIMATRRHYSQETQARLADVFGESSRWGETVRSLLWTYTSTVIPAFSGDTIVDLPIPCTYDFDVVSTKYFDALEDGEIPLSFLFSGTIFYADTSGRLQISQIPWSKEANYRLSISLWRAMINAYYPASAWIRMPKTTFDQLYQYKVQHGLPTWADVFAHLLASNEQRAQP